MDAFTGIEVEVYLIILIYVSVELYFYRKFHHSGNKYKLMANSNLQKQNEPQCLLGTLLSNWSRLWWRDKFRITQISDYSQVPELFFDWMTKLWHFIILWEKIAWSSTCPSPNCHLLIGSWYEVLGAVLGLDRTPWRWHSQSHSQTKDFTIAQPVRLVVNLLPDWKFSKNPLILLAIAF